MGILKRIACVASFRRMCILSIAIVAAMMLAVTAFGYTEVQDAYEPDDTVGQAKPLVLGAAKQARTLHYNPPTGDVDWVSFSATAGTSYVIQTGDLNPDTTDTVLHLYGVDGATLLAENDDYGFSFASRIAWKAPASGTYYVRVSGFHSGISGAYTLELRQAGALTGRVTKQGTTKPLADITVDLWQYDQDGYYAMFETKTDADGNYSFDAVPAGTWRVGFYDWDRKVFAPRFYVNSAAVEQATNVSVTAGNTTSGINIALAALPKTFVSIEGPNRFATAVAASKRAFPGTLSSTGEQTVVIATGRNWPDALGGTALAGVLGGPVLLVDTNSVPGVVMEEIRRLGAKKAVILGGTVAVGTAVESALKTELGQSNVRRIKGDDRYRTADAIAAEVMALQAGEFAGKAFVATGGNFPDALAAAPLAAAGGRPLFLADPKAGLRDATKTAMDGVAEVAILGGTNAVSSAVETYLQGRFGVSDVARLDGEDRYETASKIAAYGVANGMKWDGVGVATGTDFPDAMSGGAMLGRRNSVMVLTRPKVLPEQTRQALNAHMDDIATVHFIGGTSAISTEVRTAVSNALK